MVWDEWGRITRYLESSRFTLLMAASNWDRLLSLEPTDAQLEVELQGTLYRVSLDQHVSALRDMWCLHSSVLVLYYSLTETAAVERLQLKDAMGCNGAEDWGGRLLNSAGADWRDEDERIGLVEVGVVRNLIAHGERVYSERAIAKLRAAGKSPLPEVGDRVVLDYETLKLYRSRLKRLLNRGGLGEAAV